jgi:hypothetical protein
MIAVTRERAADNPKTTCQDARYHVHTGRTIAITAPIDTGPK